MYKRQPLVQLQELLHREVDLAADLHQVRDAVALQAVRDLGDRADVGRDVLARTAVTAGRGAGQPALLVRQVDREAVDLQLAQEVVAGALRVAAQLRRDPLGPGRQLLVVEGVVQREHPLAVRDLGELGLVLPGDLLRGRVRGAQLGVLLLQRLQGPQQLVELRVADDGGVPHVIAEAVLLDLLGQMGMLFPRLRGHRVPRRVLFAGHRYVLPWSLSAVTQGCLRAISRPGRSGRAPNGHMRAKRPPARTTG